MTPYDLLDHVRALLRNAELSPLPDKRAQAQVLVHLTHLRALYRAAHDRAAA